MSSQPLNSAAGVASLRICPQCGFKNREDSKFCGHCGASLVKHCPQCGARIPIGARFCECCGTDCEQALISGERCQRCGFQNDQNAEFCAQCGARLLVGCPQCKAMTRATLSFCIHCGFDYSRFVTEKVMGKVEEKTAGGRESVEARGPASGIMIALIILSLVLIIYILRQV